MAEERENKVKVRPFGKLKRTECCVEFLKCKKRQRLEEGRSASLADGSRGVYVMSAAK